MASNLPLSCANIYRIVFVRSGSGGSSRHATHAEPIHKNENEIKKEYSDNVAAFTIYSIHLGHRHRVTVETARVKKCLMMMTDYLSVSLAVAATSRYKPP